MRLFAVVLGVSVVMLGGCNPTLTRRSIEPDPKLQTVLIQLKSDLARLDRRMVTQADGQLSCGKNQVAMSMVRSGISAKASLNISNTDEQGREVALDKVPIIKIGVSGSASQNESAKKTDSSEFDVDLSLTNETDSPTNLSGLGQLVAAAEKDFLTMPHDPPCLTPKTLTVTSAIQITRKEGGDIAINYLIVSGKRTWSQEHAYDGTIAITITYDRSSPPGNPM